ncbi:MAG: hypothetical protein IJP72_02380 [Bacteroidales bacterium]|nr:hypothetical protein [Bacteroidales bacterium]
MEGRIINIQNVYEILRKSNQRKVSKEMAYKMLLSIGVINQDGTFTEDFKHLGIASTK